MREEDNNLVLDDIIIVESDEISDDINIDISDDDDDIDLSIIDENENINISDDDDDINIDIDDESYSSISASSLFESYTIDYHKLCSTLFNNIKNIRESLIKSNEQVEISFSKSEYKNYMSDSEFVVYSNIMKRYLLDSSAEIKNASDVYNDILNEMYVSLKWVPGVNEDEFRKVCQTTYQKLRKKIVATHTKSVKQLNNFINLESLNNILLVTSINTTLFTKLNQIYLELCDSPEKDNILLPIEYVGEYLRQYIDSNPDFNIITNDNKGVNLKNIFSLIVNILYTSDDLPLDLREKERFAELFRRELLLELTGCDVKFNNEICESLESDKNKIGSLYQKLLEISYNLEVGNSLLLEFLALLLITPNLKDNMLYNDIINYLRVFNDSPYLLNPLSYTTVIDNGTNVYELGVPNSGSLDYIKSDSLLLSIIGNGTESFILPEIKVCEDIMAVILPPPELSVDIAGTTLPKKGNNIFGMYYTYTFTSKNLLDNGIPVETSSSKSIIDKDWSLKRPDTLLNITLDADYPFYTTQPTEDDSESIDDSILSLRNEFRDIKFNKFNEYVLPYTEQSEDMNYPFEIYFLGSNECPKFTLIGFVSNKGIPEEGIKPLRVTVNNTDVVTRNMVVTKEGLMIPYYDNYGSDGTLKITFDELNDVSVCTVKSDYHDIVGLFILRENTTKQFDFSNTIYNDVLSLINLTDCSIQYDDYYITSISKNLCELSCLNYDDLLINARDCINRDLHRLLGFSLLDQAIAVVAMKSHLDILEHSNSQQLKGDGTNNEDNIYDSLNFELLADTYLILTNKVITVSNLKESGRLEELLKECKEIVSNNINYFESLKNIISKVDIAKLSAHILCKESSNTYDDKLYDALLGIPFMYKFLRLMEGCMIIWQCISVIGDDIRFILYRVAKEKSGVDNSIGVNDFVVKKAMLNDSKGKDKPKCELYMTHEILYNRKTIPVSIKSAILTQNLYLLYKLVSSSVNISDSVVNLKEKLLDLTNNENLTEEEFSKLVNQSDSYDFFYNNFEDCVDVVYNCTLEELLVEGGTNLTASFDKYISYGAFLTVISASHENNSEYIKKLADYIGSYIVANSYCNGGALENLSRGLSVISEFKKDSSCIPSLKDLNILKTLNLFETRLE